MTTADERRLCVAMSIARIKPCLLCGDDAVAVGVFFPYAAHVLEYGGKAGKGRAVAYSLCERCLASPTKTRDAEDKIRHGVTARRELDGRPS